MENINNKELNISDLTISQFEQMAIEILGNNRVEVEPFIYYKKVDRKESNRYHVSTANGVVLFVQSAQVIHSEAEGWHDEFPPHYHSSVGMLGYMHQEVIWKELPVSPSKDVNNAKINRVCTRLDISMEYSNEAMAGMNDNNTRLFGKDGYIMVWGWKAQTY